MLCATLRLSFYIYLAFIILGVEFMLPCQAFFCNLCKEFSGDVFAARNHLESEKHNTSYSVC